MNITLVSIDPFSPVLELAIDTFPAMIGSNGQRADVCLADHEGGTQYCELSVCDGVLMVRDLKSKHPTLVNGKPTRRAALASGDTLTIGIRYLQVTDGNERSVDSPGSLAMKNGKMSSTRKTLRQHLAKSV